MLNLIRRLGPSPQVLRQFYDKDEDYITHEIEGHISHLVFLRKHQSPADFSPERLKWHYRHEWKGFPSEIVWFRPYRRLNGVERWRSESFIPTRYLFSTLMETMSAQANDAEND